MEHNIYFTLVSGNLFAADGNGITFRTYLVADLSDLTVDFNLALCNKLLRLAS